MSVRNIITISIIKCLNGLSELQSNWIVKWMTIYDKKKIFEFVPYLNVSMLVPTIWQLQKDFFSSFQIIWSVYCTYIYRET